MKRLIVFALAMPALLLASCNQSEPKQDDSKITKVTVSPAKVDLIVGDTESLEISVEPSGAVYSSVSWSSSDKSVATVSRKGVVTAVAKGSAVITADVDGVKGECNVTVSPNSTPVTGVTLSETSLVLEAGSSANLTATVTPDSAADKTVTWSSTDSGIATVSDGFVTGVSKGECDIVVKTKDGGYEAKCHVTVNSDVTIYTCTLPGRNWSKNTYPVFNKDASKAYIISLQDGDLGRYLYEIDLQSHQLGWSLELTNQTKAWSSNGGDICVNPNTGDIICSNQCEVFAVTSAGQKKWTISTDGTGLNSDNTSSAMLGCGPAMSNDCSVIFACINNKMVAINASTGAIIDTIDGFTNCIQFIVYGNDNIVYHKNNATGGVGFLTFADGKFTRTAEIDLSVKVAASDITSGAMTKDQKKAYFCGSIYTLCVDIDAKTVEIENRSSSIGGGQRWAPCISPDGYLYMASVFNGSTAAIVSFNTAESIANDANGSAIYKYSGYNSAYNFEGVCVDKDNNVYSFINDCKAAIGKSAKSYLIRLTKGGNGYDAKNIAILESATQGTFQGCFNIGGKYIVATQGKPGTVYIFELETTRAEGWSGPGGDISATKNANLVYGN